MYIFFKPVSFTPCFDLLNMEDFKRLNWSTFSAQPRKKSQEQNLIKLMHKNRQRFFVFC